jgi:hypothetical protein
MMLVRLAGSACLLAGSAAITRSHPAEASTPYTVPQLYHMLSQNPQVLAGKQVAVAGRVVLALWVNPVPGMAVKRWQTGDLNAATCRTGTAAGCQPQGFPLNSGWFVLVRLVPTNAGRIAGNPATYVPGIWLRVVPSSAWAQAGVQRVHYGSEAAYRVRVQHSCTASIFCSDALLIPSKS